MKEPVVLKSGVTYERQTILQSLNSAGNFCPVTREEVSPSDALLPNNGIKNATADFLQS